MLLHKITHTHKTVLKLLYIGSVGIGSLCGF